MCVEWNVSGKSYYSQVLLSRGLIYHDITYDPTITVSENGSNIRVTTKNPYLALTGELWCVYCEEFGEKWPRYNGTALYFHLCPGCLNPIKLISKVYLHGCCMNKDVWTCIIRGLSKSWDVMTWVDFTHYWHFVRGIHRSPVHSPHKGSIVQNIYVNWNKLFNKKSNCRWAKTTWRPCGVTETCSCTYMTAVPDVQCSHTLGRDLCFAIQQLWAIKNSSSDQTDFKEEISI